MMNASPFKGVKNNSKLIALVIINIEKSTENRVNH